FPGQVVIQLHGLTFAGIVVLRAVVEAADGGALWHTTGLTVLFRLGASVEGAAGRITQLAGRAQAQVGDWVSGGRFLVVVIELACGLRAYQGWILAVLARIYPVDVGVKRDAKHQPETGFRRAAVEGRAVICPGTQAFKFLARNEVDRPRDSNGTI